MVEINPKTEIEYRLKLAQQYLDDSVKAFKRGDYRNCVMSAQLSVENAAKAIIAVYMIPSWSHDPSLELKKILKKLPKDLRKKVNRIGEIAHELAPEHGRTTYGEPLKGLTPWEIYDEKISKRILNEAKEAIKLMKEVLKRIWK